MKIDYYTFDFETANESMASACSIGIVGVSDKRIVYQEHFLINPLMPFSQFNISIHHITEQDVSSQPSFDELWPKISHVFDDTLVFAHNAGFDIAVLNAVLEKYNIEKPHFRFGCTVRLARCLWPKEDIQNHRLHTVAGFLGVQFQHHHALSDAMVLVDIINRGLKIYQVDDVETLYHHCHLRFGLFSRNNLYQTHSVRQYNQKTPIVENKQLLHKLIAFAGKPGCMTKKQWILLLESHGAFIDKTFSNRCDVLIICSNASHNIIDNAKHLCKQGADLLIIDEQTLLIHLISVDKSKSVE